MKKIKRFLIFFEKKPTLPKSNMKNSGGQLHHGKNQTTITNYHIVTKLYENFGWPILSEKNQKILTKT
jgi:hypothetical protein